MLAEVALRPPSVAELHEIVGWGNEDVKWWCSVLRGWDGLPNPDEEVSERQLVTFRGSGPIMVNAHDVAWESEGHGWGWCNGVAAWRNEIGGEALCTVGFPRKMLEPGDRIKFRVGGLRMPARELQ